MRRLIVETNGAVVNVVESNLTPLEVRSALQLLLSLVDAGQFPLPEWADDPVKRGAEQSAPASSSE